MLILVLKYGENQVASGEGALPPGPLPGAWPLNLIHLGLHSKSLKCPTLQKIFTSWFMLPDSKHFCYALLVDHKGPKTFQR